MNTRPVLAWGEGSSRGNRPLSLLPGSLLERVGCVLWPHHQGYFSLLLGSCKKRNPAVKNKSLFSIWQCLSGAGVCVCVCAHVCLGGTKADLISGLV